MLDSFDESSEKVIMCLDTSDTLEQLDTSSKMIRNFIRIYKPSSVVVHDLMTMYEYKYNKFTEGVH